MTKKLYEENNIREIANAIRDKQGSNTQYTTAQMPNAIRQLNPSLLLQEKTVTANGVVLPDSGYDGLSKVNVNVSGQDQGSSIIKPIYSGNSYCYITTDGALYCSDANKWPYINFFEIKAGHKYAFFVDNPIGARRRAAFFSSNTFQDFEEYIDTPYSNAKMYQGIRISAPIDPRIDDTESKLIGRIIFASGTDGIFIYGTDNQASDNIDLPVYCIDLGQVECRGGHIMSSRAYWNSSTSVWCATMHGTVYTAFEDSISYSSGSNTNVILIAASETPDAYIEVGTRFSTPSTVSALQVTYNEKTFYAAHDRRPHDVWQTYSDYGIEQLYNDKSISDKDIYKIAYDMLFDSEN